MSEIIRLARIEETSLLSELGFRSKAYWGYDSNFMEACRDDLTVSPEYILTKMVYVIEEDGRIKGFCGLQKQDERTVKLLDLFVEPEAIGKGFGRQLWQYALHKARQLGFTQIIVDSDPYAEKFYLAMGAVRVGQIPSSVFPERELPLMSYTF